LLEDRYDGPVVDYYMPPVSADWRGGTESPRRRPRAGPTKVEIASAAYRLWEVLTSLAEESRRTTLSGLATAGGATAGLVRVALADIAGSCKALCLPPLVIVVDSPEPVLPEFAALTPAEHAAALAEVAEYPWDALGNPYSFAQHGAGYEELLSRLLVEPDSAGTVFRLVRHRGRAQQIFRDALLRAYDGRCALTGSSIRAGLEAAHLVPWNYATNAQRVDVRNGILLASWHHRLFDAGILRIDENLSIRVDGDALAAAFGVDRAALEPLDGVALHLPSDPRHHPDVELVRLRNELARQPPRTA
jgi:putative restriction endonuclease